MQEVSGSNPRLGGPGVDPLQLSGGTSTLQSRASGLQSTTQGHSIRTKKITPSQTTKGVERIQGEKVERRRLLFCTQDAPERAGDPAKRI